MDAFAVDAARFNDGGQVESRLAAAPAEVRGALKTALTYLYFDAGPANLPRARLRLAEPYLEPVERITARWMQTRTNGRLRRAYGPGALHAARAGRYRCADCGYADVRALNIDHVDGKVAGTAFACLCANCHAIQSRDKDWLGHAGRTA